MPALARARSPWWCLPACLGLLGGACEAMEPECEEPSALAPGTHDLRVISYNIGNADKERPYALRIRDVAYEAFLGARIRERAADVVLLQEVLPPTLCDTFEESSPERTCHASHGPTAAAKRILGDDYSVACDANDHIECIGVRTSFGTIRGLAAGAFGLSHASTPELPGPPCDYVAGECQTWAESCDSESSVSSVVVDTARGALRIVHVHPTAIGESCLLGQVKQAFAMADALPTLIGGDWNFDPTMAIDLPAAALYGKWVGPGRRYVEHAGRAGPSCRLARTTPSHDASLDRVISDFARGRCTVRSAPRLDDGYDFASLEGGRVDHYAVECDLAWSAP